MQNKNDEVIYCAFCSKRAEFYCGKCFEAAYCSAEHQANDWGSHRTKCISPDEKLKELKHESKQKRKVFFDKLSKGKMYDSQILCEEMIQIDKQIVKRFPSDIHEIEYGASVCAYIKILMSLKNFNDANDISEKYLQAREVFFNSTEKIPSKLKEPEQNSAQRKQFEEKRNFVEGKIKLIATFSNLKHQLSRTSTSIFEILMNHCVKFYGYFSLEVSNIYFEIGNYYHHLGQYNKAIACYWISGNIRKQKGVISFYNTAVIFLKQSRYKKALKYFTHVQNLVQKYQTHQQLTPHIYMGLGICSIKLNLPLFQSIDYFEKVYSHYSLHNRNDQNCFEVKIVLRRLQHYLRIEYDNDESLTLHREEPHQHKPLIITNQNYEDYWNFDKTGRFNNKKAEWQESFKRQNEKTKFVSNVSYTNKIVQKNLFTDYFLSKDKSDQYKYQVLNEQNLQIDEPLMSSLSAKELEFLNELNRQIGACKDKQLIYDIVESSNLIQCLTEEKLERLYQLNPSIMRPSVDEDIRRGLLELLQNRSREEKSSRKIEVGGLKK